VIPFCAADPTDDLIPSTVTGPAGIVRLEVLKLVCPISSYDSTISAAARHCFGLIRATGARNLIWRKK
jgi:hypothetical protein